MANVFTEDYAALLPWFVLALGGAMAAGSIGALLRPRTEGREGELAQAPVARSLAFAGVGLVISLWALVSIIT